MELCVQDGSSQIIYSRNETKTRNFESELRISKVFHVLTVGNEDQTPIRNLDNTFVDHTSDYKTRLVYKDALKSISSKTGALFPRMNQFESQTSFLSMDSSSTSNRVSFDNNKDVEDEEEQELTTPDNRGKRKESPTANEANKAPRILPPRSKIWNHYTRTKDKRDKCICHYCKKNFCCKTKSGTKNLLKHISICKQFYSYSDGQSSTQQVIDEEGNVMSTKISEETFKEATNEMMVIGELPLCWVESVAWKHFYEIRQTCVKEDLNKGDCKDVLAEEGCYEKVV